jgi:hypothetical protein
VLATGPGVTVTKLAAGAVINCPVGVQIISASLHFFAADTTTAATTGLLIDFGSSAGTGDNTSYSTLFCPQFQAYIDDGAGYANKSTAQGNLSVNSHTLKLASLTNSQAIWVNISF